LRWLRVPGLPRLPLRWLRLPLRWLRWLRLRWRRLPLLRLLATCRQVAARRTTEAPTIREPRAARAKSLRDIATGLSAASRPRAATAIDGISISATEAVAKIEIAPTAARPINARVPLIPVP